jgi:hypothetical protein
MEFSNDTKVLMDSVMALPVRVEALESENTACLSDGEFRVEFALEPEQREQSRATVIGWVVKNAQNLELKHIPRFTNDEEPPLRLSKSVKFKIRREETSHRLHDYMDEWLAFVFVECLQLSSNPAERDTRHLRVMDNCKFLKGYHKNSQSYSSTLCKHSMNVFNSLFNDLDRKSVIFKAG